MNEKYGFQDIRQIHLFSVTCRLYFNIILFLDFTRHIEILFISVAYDKPPHSSINFCKKLPYTEYGREFRCRGPSARECPWGVPYSFDAPLDIRSLVYGQIKKKNNNKKVTAGCSANRFIIIFLSAETAHAETRHNFRKG